MARPHWMKLKYGIVNFNRCFFFNYKFIVDCFARLEDPNFKAQFKFDIKPGYLVVPTLIINQTDSGPKMKRTTAKMALVYADDELILLYDCVEAQSLDSITINERFLILARNRLFNSNSKFYAAVKVLLDFGVNWNDMLIDYNGSNCKN